MAEDDALSRWWEGLPEERRAEARALKQGEIMPAWMVVTLAQAGRPFLSAAWFPSTHPGPGRFPMHGKLHRFISAQDC